MEKTYQPKNIEQKWYQTWENNHYFAPTGDGTPYCIMIPPPNVTGVLHMGHAFQAAVQDALTRYHRMCGEQTLWQPGTDHAGIATQIMVERQLSLEGKSRKAIGRDAFVARAWDWKEKSGSTITQQFRRLGISVDWQRERFTLDDDLNKAVREAFVRLYDEGIIYRGKRLVNWDPTLHTALSDLEVVSVEQEGKLWHIRYPLADGSGHLTIATTRPETMLGDTGVAVHPEDERYQNLIGKTVILPLCQREIPIVADEVVDPSFGTGCVKITPAHDFADFEIGQRNQLAQIMIFDENAVVNDNAPADYVGLDRFAARNKVVEHLDAAGLIDKVESHMMAIPKGERSDVVVEPMLTNQWYVKADELAKDAIAVVKDKRVRFVPENWENTYFHWMENIQDWCISRQLWWGHRIPAWYDDAGEVYVGRDEQAVREKYKLSASHALRQDEDVLDTWFSSALWPFSTLGWPEQTKSLQTFYPTNVLVTGFDIIFFWVARMIMMGMKFMGEVPFHEVYITPLIRDGEGKKMSKSKGNALDPLDIVDGIDIEALVKKNTAAVMQGSLVKKVEQATRKEFPNGIEAHGTDALRFTLCAVASPGRNINFDLSRVGGNRNFCNKLWNCARYVLMNTETHDTGINNNNLPLSVADRWIRSMLAQVITSTHQHYKNYRFDLMCQGLYDFTWHAFCDWYLELSKPVLFAEGESPTKTATRKTLVCVLETLLRLLHPLMPYITEEIWARVAPLTGNTGETIMLQAFPTANDSMIDEEAEAEIAWCQQFIVGIRNIRGEMNIAPGKALPVLCANTNAADLARLETNQHLLQTLAKCESITVLAKDEPTPQAATALVGKMELLIPMAGLIDVQAESARLQKELAKLEKDLQGVQNKLSNPKFVTGAPEAIVNKEKQRLAQLEDAKSQLTEKLEKLGELEN